jgi:alkylated DNA repair dioxygenase AlkB
MIARSQTDLFGAAPDIPEGFVYQDDMLTSTEETHLVSQFAKLAFKPFEFHGYLGNRRVVSFGWRYDYSGKALRESPPIPEFLLPLRKKAAAFAGIEADSLQQALVTEYAAGAGIGWHKDKPMFQDVIAFSFLSACTLRLRRKIGGAWERKSLIANPCSAYMLRGISRAQWEHSIPPLDTLRYSVTFRNFVDPGKR